MESLAGRGSDGSTAPSISMQCVVYGIFVGCSCVESLRRERVRV